MKPYKIYEEDLGDTQGLVVTIIIANLSTIIIANLSEVEARDLINYARFMIMEGE